MVPSWADQLLLQLSIKQFDTLPIQWRHNDYMHEGVWFRIYFFLQNDSCENLDNFSLIKCLYMHRWCLYTPINSYNSFWWSNLILCLYNADTLNICMKGFGSEKNNFDKMTAVRTWTIFPYLGFCICIDGAFMGRSTPTTAFDGTIWYFADTM